jgi:prepilin-type N-terminal cleavage/methylation domain-containing protein
VLMINLLAAIRKRCRDRVDCSSDGGFTMAELVVSMSILVIVSTMSIAVLISTQKATKLVSWQSLANSELRQFVDSSFAEIETARPRTVCFGPDGRAQALMPQTCERPVEGLGSPFESAGEKHVCYLSHRVNPAFDTGTTPEAGVTPTSQVGYSRVCIAIIDNQLWKAVWALNPSNMNAPVANTVRYTNLGAVSSAASSFRFFGKGAPTVAGGVETDVEIIPPDCSVSGATRTCPAYDASTPARVPTDISANPATQIPGSAASAFFGDYMVPADRTSHPGQIAGPIANITRMKVVITVETKTGRTSHLRALEYDVSLRGSKYQNERCYTGERTVDSTGALICV